MRNLKLEYKIRKLEKQLYEAKQVGTLYQQLYEAKQVGTLYHVCTPDAYLKYIYPNDQLSASGKYINYLYNGSDYVSFTRDKYFVVDTDTINNSSILFQLVVDGNKLSDNYKVRPYNDFAFTDYSTTTNPKLLEKEEVVKGPIKNISNYIKEIHFDLFAINDRVIDNLKTLADNPAIKSSNIVYYNFIMKNKSVKLKRLIKESGIKNGDQIQLVAERLEHALENDLEPLLFSEDINKIKQAIKLGADLNALYTNGYLLEYYCKDKYLPIIELLLDNGAKPEFSGTSSLHFAAQYGQPKVAQCLIDHGADVNYVNKNKATPIMLAAFNNYYDIVELLIKSGADVNTAI